MSNHDAATDAATGPSINSSNGVDAVDQGGLAKIHSYMDRRKAALVAAVVNETAFRPHMLDGDASSAMHTAPLQQRTDVCTWNSILTLNAVTVWRIVPATPPQRDQLSLYVILRPADADLRPYHDYLSSIDLYTAVGVYTATVAQQARLHNLFQRSLPTDRVCVEEEEEGSDDDPVLRFTGDLSPSEYTAIAKSWTAYHFNQFEIQRLHDLIRSAAQRHNTLYLLPTTLRADTVDGPGINGKQLCKILDIQTAWYHIDYSSVDAFGTSVVAAIRRISFVYHHWMFQPEDKEDEDGVDPQRDLAPFFNGALYRIIARAIKRFGTRYGGMRAFERVAVQIMRTLTDDTCIRTPMGTIPRTNHIYECEKQARHLEQALAQRPGDMDLRTRVFVVRRLAYDDYCFINCTVRASAVLSFIGVAFTLTSQGHFAHPPLRPIPFKDDTVDESENDNVVTDMRFYAHHALASLILSGAEPDSITCFMDRWNPLEHKECDYTANAVAAVNQLSLYDPWVYASRLPDAAVAAANAAVARAGALAFGTMNEGDEDGGGLPNEVFCMPVLWVMRQLVEWGDLDAAQMAALAAYLDHPFCSNIVTAHETEPALEIAQILTSIPTTCNLFCVCMGVSEATRSAQDCTTTDVALQLLDVEHANGNPLPVRLRDLVARVVAAKGSIQATRASRTRESYSWSPFFGEEPDLRPSQLLQHFSQWLLCQPVVRRTWKELLAQIMAVHGSSGSCGGSNCTCSSSMRLASNVPHRNFVVDLTGDAVLMLQMPRETVLQLRALLQPDPVDVVDQTFQHRRLRQALANIETNYMAPHRELAIVAQSRLFTTRVVNRPDAPFSCHLPDDIVLDIMGFVTAVATVNQERSNETLTTAHIFASAGASFIATLHGEQPAQCTQCSSSQICARCSTSYSDSDASPSAKRQRHA